MTGRLIKRSKPEDQSQKIKARRSKPKDQSLHNQAFQSREDSQSNKKLTIDNSQSINHL
jgi:hypothetical protein